MKTLKKIGMAFVAILICLCYSCSSESEFPTTPTPEVPESPQESKMVTVKLNVKDIMSVQEELMESRTNINDYNDLYMVDIVDVNYNTYALGMFDLSKDIKVELPEGGKFCFRAVAVKDGKDKIYVNPDGIYAPPFAGKFTNEFTTEIPENYEYSPDFYILKDGNSYKETMIAKDLEVYTFDSDFDSSDPFIASDTNDEEIELSPVRRFYIGTEFVAEDMEEGKLIVSFSANASNGDTYSSPEVEITAEDTPVFNTFSFGSVFTGAIMGFNGVNIKLHMKWLKADGSEVTLPNEQAYITVKNSYKYSIKINVGTTSKAAMNIYEIETPTFSDSNTEHWNVEEGTASKK